MEVEERDLKIANPAWADAMSKILKTKKRKGKSLILAKAKLITENKVKVENDVDTFEVVGKSGEKVIHTTNINDVKEEKLDFDKLEPKIPKRIRIREQVLLGRIKPSVSDRVKEKNLSKIATKGVVQLFNMVKQQQRTVEKSLKNVGTSIIKQDKVLDSLDKKKFLEPFDHKNESVNTGWDVLRDDFMGGTKIKDWDKITEEESDEDTNI
ncbi:RRP15-like protein [Adelges cooleyi]|uniref:RRP15-like protein n=1 Tax=Adelges cooleyi TaxID=133065 RepID=UPI00217F676D|nr:RRP15-like protein [Adelges cooleyi]XP_050432262.1 RRP15-like protein [Adelges cooleyi]